MCNYQVTSGFHDLTMRLQRAEEALLNADGSTRCELQRNITELKASLLELGGRNRYQEASIISTKHHQTSKWFLQSVRALRPDWRSLTGDKRLRLLEVGAINTQLLRCPWLLVRAIDLNSQHPDIEEMDFFDLLPEPVYDFVVSSMVVNCVPEPEKRVEMLARLSGCLRDASEESSLGGVLFLTLPTRFIAGCSCGKCIRKKSSTDAGATANVALEAFLLMLRLCGLAEAAPRRETPKLMFLTLAKQKQELCSFVRVSSNVSKNVDLGSFGGTMSKAVLLKLCTDFQTQFNVLPFCICALRSGYEPSAAINTSNVVGSSSSSSSSFKLPTHCSECGSLPCASLSIVDLLCAAAADHKPTTDKKERKKQR